MFTAPEGGYMSGSKSLQGLESYSKPREGSGFGARGWSVIILIALIVAGIVVYEVWGGPTAPTPIPASSPASR